MKNWRGFRGLLGYLWEHRVYSVLGLLFCFFADAAQLGVPLMAKSAIDQLAAGSRDAQMLARQAGLILGTALLAYGARYSWRHFMFSGARLVELDIRQKLFDRVVRLPLSEHHRSRSGDVMSLATNDVMAVRMALAFGLMASFDAIAYSAMSIAAMIHLDRPLALACLAPYPLLALLMVFLMDKNYKTWDRVQSAFDDLVEKSRESVAGVRVVRAYTQEKADVADFHKQTEELYQRMMTHARWDAIYTPAITFVSGISSAILLALGGSHVIAGTTTVGSFTAFSSYLGQLTWPMIAAGWTMAIVQRASASMSRLLDMLERTSEFPENDPPEWNAQGEVEIRNLTFSYPEAASAALTEVSFRIPVGKTLGVVGEVGSGKSTLAHALLALYPIAPQTIWIDGQDITTLDPRQVRANISWVSQEAFLFSESIEDNLRLGRSELDRPRLLEASHAAALHEEVLEFPQGYDTMLGERGITLSGGQKQRLSLARSLLKPAPILVLDDTLSAVDAHTERQILEALRQRIQGRTAIIISHRISSVRDADEIIVLERGSVIQRGNHAQLCEQPGLYRKLFEMQTHLEEAQ